jgi:hypothetical protein
MSEIRNPFFDEGVISERERIVQLLETQPFIWAGDVQMLTVSRDALIDLINAEVQA